MKTFLAERFLTQFLLNKAILRGVVDESVFNDMFYDLAKIFHLPFSSEELSELYQRVESAPFDSICDKDAYMRLCRTVEFGGIKLDECDRMIITSLGDAMRGKDSVFTEKNLTASSVADRLDRAAMSGNVSAMAALSYFELKGILVRCDKESAHRRMALVADWNNVFGNLLALFCTKEYTYIENLYTILDTPNQRAALAHICNEVKCELPCAAVPRVKILETAFEMQILDRNVFDRKLSQILFSPLVSNEDKKKLILDKHAEEYLKIPFGASVEPVNFNQNEFHAFKGREREREDILCAISPIWCGCDELYRPLLLVESGESQASGIYYNGLKNGFKHVVEIDGATMTKQDFYPTELHFLIRAVSETRCASVAVFVRNCEMIDEELREEFANLIRRDFRSKFKLASPAINFDLSHVVFVLFANRVVREFEPLCSVNKIEHLTTAEKAEVIGDIFAARTARLNLDIQIDGEAIEKLTTVSMAHISRIVDDLLRHAIFKNKSRVEWEDISLLPGDVERRDEFGYFGGAYEEL